MTSKTKSGKECPRCGGKGRRMWRGPDEACIDCHGLGWIPKPGDELTAVEANSFQGSGRIQIRRKGGVWVDYISSDRPTSINDYIFEFRLARAPQEAEKFPSIERLRPSEELRELKQQNQELIKKVRDLLQEEPATKIFPPLYLDPEEQSRIDAMDEPAAKVESVEEARTRLYLQHQEWCDADGYNLGWEKCFAWILSLTPAQLDELRKELK